MSKLVLLGGPTGVGKSTTLALLAGRLPGSALLDADDVWRVSSDLAVAGNRTFAIANVAAVMRGYFRAGCDVGILAWVFARPELYEHVMDELKDDVGSIHQVYLVASREQLERRLVERGSADRLEYSVSRLELIEQLPHARIDTSGISPSEAADHVLDYVSSL